MESRWRGLNPRPPGPKPGALPTALHLEMKTTKQTKRTVGRAEPLLCEPNFCHSQIPNVFDGLHSLGLYLPPFQEFLKRVARTSPDYCCLSRSSVSPRPTSSPTAFSSTSSFSRRLWFPCQIHTLGCYQRALRLQQYFALQFRVRITARHSR